MKNKALDENNLVVQSNSLIEASYTMTANELRLFEMCISQVDSRVKLDGDRVFTFSVADVVDLFSDTKNAYASLKAVSERLFRREVRIKINEHEEVLTHFVDWINYDNREYVLKLKLAEHIVPYVSQLEKHFTKYRLKYTKNLSSVYSHRVYQLIVSWAGQGKDFFEIELDALRAMLADGKYKNNKDFRVRVLDVAISEINAHTDFNISMYLVKRKKSFDKVQFMFSRKPDAIKADNKITEDKEKQSAFNAGQKAKRIGLEKAEKEDKKLKISLAEYDDKYPEGTVFRTLDGSEFRKTANGTLTNDKGKGAIVATVAIKMLEAGELSGIFS